MLWADSCFILCIPLSSVTNKWSLPLQETCWRRFQAKPLLFQAVPASSKCVLGLHTELHSIFLWGNTSPMPYTASIHIQSNIKQRQGFDVTRGSHDVTHFAFRGIQNTTVGELWSSLVVLLPNPFCWHLNLFSDHLVNLNKWQEWLMGFNSTLCPASKSLTKYNLAKALWWMSTLLIDCGLCPFIYSKPLISNSFSNILKIKML